MAKSQEELSSLEKDVAWEELGSLFSWEKSFREENLGCSAFMPVQVKYLYM